MRKLLLPALLIGIGAFALLGCEGDNKTKTTTNTGGDIYAGCTNQATCCTSENTVCVGNPDTTVTCSCVDLWDCSKNPKKCVQDNPVPDGNGGWKCEWTATQYKCEKTGTADSAPNGGSDWTCAFNNSEFQWECVRNEVPNPTNRPDGIGVWNCEVKDGKLDCTRTDTPNTTTTKPEGTGDFTCKEENGKTVCKSPSGLPSGGSDWKCNSYESNGQVYWICYGKSDGSTPVGGGVWNCEKVDNEFGDLKCVKKEETGDYPSGGGDYACMKGSEFGGTECVKTPTTPQPPTGSNPPETKCAIGDKMWCDGMQYCGWGVVECDPATLKWKTIIKDGIAVLDCQERADGKVPNTVCACYHFYFNASCCERPDCVIPTGTEGQICPASPGKICDYCNPRKEGSCTQAGATCIVSNQHETFCGQNCASQPCPTGYNCMTVKLIGGSTQQCVPTDFSCYY